MKHLNYFNVTPTRPWESEEIEWRDLKIKELVKEVKSGFALSKQKRRKIDANNGIPQLRPYNIANWNKINFDELTFVPKNMQGIEEYFISKGDILFNNTNSVELVGRAAVYKELFGNYTYSNHITRIRVKKQVIIPDFLSWYLNYLWSKGFFYLKATKWIGQAGISNKKLLSVKISIPFRNGKPDLETQKKIVEYIEANFSKIDKILEKKKKELEQLDELWESILEQAFKPEEGEGWREMRLGKIAREIKSGGTPSRKNKEYWENGTIPWVKIQDIPEEGHVDNTEEKITKKGLNSSSAKLLPKGTLLFTIFATIGRVGILNIEAATNQAIAGIIPKDDYNRKYLYWVLRKFGEELTQKGRGGAQNNVNLTFLKNLKIPVPFRNGKPDLEKQKEIASYLDSVYEKIKALKEKIQNQITLLEEMKESILDEVFNHARIK